MLASKNGDFLVNHRFTLDSRNPRYSFYTQYKKENFQLNSVFVIQPGVKASMIWSPTKWFTQEMSAIVLKQENNAFWNTLVSRSVYADPHTCCELVLDNQSGLCVYVNQKVHRNLTVGMEAYYDFLSNKKFHCGVSACYSDILRKVIVTVTSHASAYCYYLRKVNDNVSLMAGCNIMGLNSRQDLRSSCVIGGKFSLPKTKTEITSTIDMSGTAKTLLREKLTSNATLSFSAEFNPFFDKYIFGMSFQYGVPVDRNNGFTPLSGVQS